MTQTCEGPPRLGSADGPEVVCFGGEHLPGSRKFPEKQAKNNYISRLRRQRLVEHLHRLGPSPLGHFIREVEAVTGTDVSARLERYAQIDPELVRVLGGDKFAPSLHCIEGAAQ